VRTGHRLPSLGPILLLAAACTACGHRGDPRPPVYPEPPAIQGLEVDQRGVEAVLRFPLPPRTAQVGGEEVELESLDVLVLTERYPVLDAELVIAALEQRRDLMVEQARVEEQRRREQERREAAEAAGEEPPPDPTPSGPARTAEEELLHRVPPAAREEWRRAGLSRESMLQAARQVRQAAQALWSRLELPTTVLDPGRPPALPEAAEAAREVAPILATIEYGRPIDSDEFVARAAARYRFAYENAERYRVGDRLQIVDLMGASPGSLRTRYYYGVRGRSVRGRTGRVQNVLQLVPEAVPVAPPDLDAVVEPTGVELSWQPPGDDIHLRRVDPTTLGYNVYRALAGEPFPPQPLNPAPLAAPTYSDTNLPWDRRLQYEVRALILPVEGNVRHEGEGARTDPLEVFDVFPPEPPSDLTIRRAGDTVTVEWTASPAPDRRGYRVYRHPLPAPGPVERDEQGWVLPREYRQAPAGPGATGGDAGGDAAEGVDPGAAGGAAGEGQETGAEAGEKDEPPEPPNPMVDAGWGLLTPEPISSTRLADQGAAADVSYAYAVETVDARGNLSVVVHAEEESRR